MLTTKFGQIYKYHIFQTMQIGLLPGNMTDIDFDVWF